MGILGVLKKSPPRLPRVLGAVETLVMNEQVKAVRRDRDLDFEYEHIRETIKYAKTLAPKRKIDPDIAGIVAALQNIGRITTGVSDSHAEAGYQPAKDLLMRVGGFTPAEIEQIATAVRNHSRKDEIDAPLDELVKDVDVYARYLQGYEISKPADLSRLRKVRLELEF